MSILPDQNANASDFLHSFVAGEDLAADDAVALLLEDDALSGGIGDRGKIYKASAAAFDGRLNFIGFVRSAYATGATALVESCTVYDGLTGLTAGANYFLANTPGAISTTPGTYHRWVGLAQSTTKIDRLRGIINIVSKPIPISANTAYTAPANGYLLSGNASDNAITVEGISLDPEMTCPVRAHQAFNTGNVTGTPYFVLSQ